MYAPIQGKQPPAGQRMNTSSCLKCWLFPSWGGKRWMQPYSATSAVPCNFSQKIILKRVLLKLWTMRQGILPEMSAWWHYRLSLEEWQKRTMRLVISAVLPTARLVRSTHVMTQHCPAFALQTPKHSRPEGNSPYLQNHKKCTQNFYMKSWRRWTTCDAWAPTRRWKDNI
jgi:hypothetical protein